MTRLKVLIFDPPVVVGGAFLQHAHHLRIGTIVSNTHVLEEGLTRRRRGETWSV